MEQVEQEFLDFFAECRKQGYSNVEMLTICRPLLWQQRCKAVKKWLLIAAVLIALYLLYVHVDGFAWFVSAIGRLLLMQLLPFWNWTPLYNAKCLIARVPDTATQTVTAPRLSKYETESGNCVLCEMLERIPTASNVSYSLLEHIYLERGLPVIVIDSHATKTLPDLLEIMLTSGTDFLTNSPCDVATNLMLKKFFELDLALQKIKTSHALDKWFLQAHNCEFSAVKASRVFVTRPYYYPLHLEPFYSSWILLAHNYRLPERELYLKGLIFVQQLSGYFDVHLRPKEPCNGICPVISLRLTAGECLVFSTDLWIFSYGTASGDDKNTAIATILEIDWQL